MAKAYERIADDLRRRVSAGELSPGDRLPAETTLVEEYAKSLPTIRQALGVLQAERLIEKLHGRGNFVRRPRTPVLRTNLRHQWEKGRARDAESDRARTGAAEHDSGLDQSDLVFRAAYREVAAEPEVAKALGVPVGTALVERVYRTRYRAEPAPFTLVRSYLVREMVAVNPDLLDEGKEPYPGGTQSQLFSIGIELDRMEEFVAARPPTVEEAEELAMPAGSAVLVVRKTAYDTDDRPVEHSVLILPGDRTEMLYTTRLDRW
ncbi:GntR family transcriptional regulator [Streptomyces polygonati]|uniref:GntR family transcriptional regulator n=1 Tax=Streptomyces polygonati TaxID=1617087 RepID=A0ABV8HLY3_9ACTN